MPKSYILKLSDTQKKELNRFMKSTRDKEEYRRRASSAIKQKMEGGLDPLKMRTPCNGDFFAPDSINRGGQTDARW